LAPAPPAFHPLTPFKSVPFQPSLNPLPKSLNLFFPLSKISFVVSLKEGLSVLLAIFLAAAFFKIAIVSLSNASPFKI